MDDSGANSFERLTLDEASVRRLVRLLADALAPNDGRPEKVERLMTGLCEWLEADAWLWARSRLAPQTAIPENYDFLYRGISHAQFAVWTERALAVNGVPPENVPLLELVGGGQPCTRTREQLIAPGAWVANAENVDYVRRFGFDATVYSVKPMQMHDGGQIVSYIQLLRTTGKPAFTTQQALLVQAILSECGQLHADGLNLSIAKDVAGLTPRQRAVLTLLIDGRSVKEAAAELGLSPHTVNDHCKAIYLHLGVNSRAALLRRFMVGSLEKESPDTAGE